MKKHVIFHTILGFILFFLITPMFLLMTHPGLELSIMLAKHFLPGELKVSKSKGQLIKNFSLIDLDYRGKKINLHIGRLDCKWRAIALLFKYLDINSLNINGIKLTIKKNSNDNARGKLNKKYYSSISPFHFSLKNIRASSAEIIYKKHHWELNHFKLEAYGHNKTVVIKRFYINSRTFQQTAKANFQLYSPFRINVYSKIELKHENLPPVKLIARASGNCKKQLLLNIDSFPKTKLYLQAMFNHLIDHGDFKIDAGWKDLVISNKEGNGVKISGGLQGYGSLDKYNISFSNKLIGDVVPNSGLSFIAHGSSNKLDISKLNFDILSGNILGNINLNWKNSLVWKTDLQIKNINLGEYLLDWRSNINANLLMAANYNNKSFVVKVNNLRGSLRKRPLSGNIDIDLKQDNVNLTNNHIRIGNNLFVLNGKLNKFWKINWKINAQELSDVYKDFSGIMIADGNIRGRFKAPHIRAEVDSSKMRFSKMLNFVKLKTKIDLNLRNRARSKFTSVGSVNLENQQHRFSVILSGVTKNNQIDFLIKRFNLFSKLFGNWCLKNNAELNVGKQRIELHNFIWNNYIGQLRADANWSNGGGLSGQIKVKNLTSTLFESFFPDGVKLNTLISGNFIFKYLRKLTADLNLKTNKIKLNVPNKNLDLVFSDADFNFKTNNEATSINLLLNQNESKNMSLQLNLPGYQFFDDVEKDQQITGKFEFEDFDLDFLPIFISNLSVLRGCLSGKFLLGGVKRSPKIYGSAKIIDGSFMLPYLGLQIKDVEFVANARNSSKLNLRGKLRSGEGVLNAVGDVDFLYGIPDLKLQLNGSKVTISNTKEYNIIASPNLAFDYRYPKLSLKGKLDIPEAKIKPQDFSETVMLPAETVIQENKKRISRNETKYYLDLDISLGKAVNFIYYGLNSMMGGNLKITSSPDQFASAVGILKVLKGNYIVYGEKLDVPNGKLIYTGNSIYNPGINMKAVKIIKDVPNLYNPDNDITTISMRHQLSETIDIAKHMRDLIVGMQIAGTLQNMQVSLFSEPIKLSDTDILSYIMVGMPSSNISSQQAQFLLKALQKVGMKDGGVEKSVQEKLGLSEFGFRNDTIYDETDQTEKKNTSLVIGKYITPKLYLNYSIGLMMPMNILRIRYLISNHWYIQSETSSQDNGADIFYTISAD